MNNPNFPGVDQDGSESLDLPASLAQLINMGNSPAAPQPGLQTGLPSFQEGGMIGEFGKAYGRNLTQNPARLIPGTGYVSAAQNLANLGRLLKQQYGQPEPKTGFEKYFPEAGKGGYSMGRIDKAIEYPAIDDPEQDALDQQYNAMLNARSSTGAAASGAGLPGLGAQRGLAGAMGSALDENRKKPTITIEEIPDTSYAEGGMVGTEGMRIPVGGVPGMPMQAGVNPQAQAQGPMNPQMVEMQLNQFARQNPQQMAQIRQAIVQELQSGELTPQELNMIVQLATVASQNPEMYPNIRNYAIQQGIATEADLPAEFDQGLVFVLLLAARAVQQDLGGAPAEAGQPPGNAGPVIPTMAKGGMLPSSGKSEPVIIEAHTGEYVIPKHVVDMKGKEFFDSLVEKYKGKKNA